MLPPPPRVLLILGTDASGKDHVADVLVRRWEALGFPVEKREGRLSAPPVKRGSSNDRKGALAHGLEALFLRSLPCIRGLLRWVLPRLLAQDIRCFRAGGRSVVVASQTALRLAAFLASESVELWPESVRWRDSLQRLAAIPGLRVLLLRVSGEIRERRIRERVASGVSDPFDRFLLRDPDRARRFDDHLMRLGTEFLDGVVIENNDLDDDALESAVQRAL